MTAEKGAQAAHRIELTDREELSVSGVYSLGSYDDKELRMETADGILTVEGEGINIKQLDLERGNVVLEGFVKALIYDEKEPAKKGIFGRFLK